jgi:hypothetical protein
MTGTRMAANFLPNKLINAMQIESQTPTKLKYPIKAKLTKMEGTYTENFLKMCLAVHISPTTGYRWADVKKDEKFSIPVDQFYLLAEFFGCNPNDLLNNG